MVIKFIMMYKASNQGVCLKKFFIKLSDRYYVVYKPITLPCILFMFIEMIFIHCHSYVIFVMKSMSIYND